MPFPFNQTPQQFHKRRLTALQLERTSYDGHWLEISEHLLPRRGRYLGMGAPGDSSTTSATGGWAAPNNWNAGAKRNDKIIDSSATHALNILASGLMSGVTSPARKWFRLVTSDHELMKRQNVRLWIETVERLMYDIFDASNLYQMLPYVYEEMGAFGTAALIQLPDYDNVVRFHAFTIGEYWIAQNHNYEVDTIYRRLGMTTEQIVSRYGRKEASPHSRWSNIPRAVESAYDRGDYDMMFPTVHAILPNPDYEEGSRNRLRRAFVQDVYMEQDDTVMLHRGGFDRFPVRVPRWHLSPPEVYGRSPGMDALGDIKQLQEQQRRKGLALAKLVNPPMVASANMKDTRMTTLPGDVTFADPTMGNSGFAPAYQVNPNLQHFVADMEDVRARIRSTMYSDLFLMISSMDRREITAYEIQQRQEEKLLALGPVLERIDNDLLRPLINDTFMTITGADDPLVPPPPEELAGMELKIEYLSIISMAQRAQGLLGIQDVVRFVGELARAQASLGQQPTAWDKLNIDAIIDDYAEKRGAPATMVIGSDEVAEERQKREQAAQQAAAIQQGKELSEAVRNLGNVDTTRQNLVADFRDAAGGQLGQPPGSPV